MTSAAAPSADGAAQLHPQRTPTFLAQYPRKLKLFVTFLLIGALVAPWVYYRPHLFFLAPAPEIPKEVELPIVPVPRETYQPPEPQAEAAPAPVTSFDAPTMEAIAQNDIDDHQARLLPTPDIALTEETAEGPLPRIDAAGRKPWQAYARPFNFTDHRPRIALVVGDLGLSNAATTAAVDRLHSNVTLAFDVQSPIVGSWLARARQVGHETLLAVPMEPFDFPRSDPGPHTLFTTLPDANNMERLFWALRQGTGYVGITTFTGSRFVTDEVKVRPVVQTLKKRGLLFFDPHLSVHSLIVDSAHHENVPATTANLRLDDTPTPEAIDAALLQLERTARMSGQAIGVAQPLPVTIDRLEAWIRTLPDKGLALAPLSALIN